METVISVVCAAAVATQRRGKQVSAETVELQQYKSFFHVVCAEGLYAGRSLEIS
jgi:lipid-binding SYLF domain-containing protein